ncbi:MAG: TIM barrel protein [Thermoplasmata archaeon]|nr:TIM barrel protein [Thermoplasmata archaeon]
MIRFGPAGIPLSCKGRTLRDGISDVHHLGLTAMEVQFIKVNPLTRIVFEEEVGKLPFEIPTQLLVEVGETQRAAPDSAALRTPLRRRQNVTGLTWSLAKDYADLAQTRALARALDVKLTLHAPYYVDFFGSDEARERSIRQIQWAGLLASGLGAGLDVTHLGFYGGGSRADSVHELAQVARELETWLQRTTNGGVHLAVEPSGHPDVFGSREEILELSHQIRGIHPVLNLPHLAARERTTFEDPVQLKALVDQFVEASHGDLYLNFSGVEFYGPTEFRLTPIKRGSIRFDALAEILADRDFDVTVISSSPLLEHDGMYLKLLYERALTRRWTKKHAPPPPKAAPPPAKVVPPAKGVRPPAHLPQKRGTTPAAKPAHRPPSRPSRPGPKRSHGRR